jgi:hypothetical protein
MRSMQFAHGAQQQIGRVGSPLHAEERRIGWRAVLCTPKRGAHWSGGPACNRFRFATPGLSCFERLSRWLSRLLSAKYLTFVFIRVHRG